MEENEEKKFQEADPRHPFIGLNNKICKHPKHWCRFHKVWLSDKDVEIRGCECKVRENGSCEVCGALIKNHYKKNINLMIKQTRKPPKGIKNRRYYDR